jgi:hypothetical protein
MDCLGETRQLVEIACAVQGLEPEWWEMWLQYLLLPLIAVAVPVFVAVWVTKKSRELTLEATRLQLDEDRNTTLDALKIQIEASNKQASEARRRDLVSRYLAVTNRQAGATAVDWSTETAAVTEVTAALDVDLNLLEMNVLRNFLVEHENDLLEIRLELISNPTALALATAEWSTDALFMAKTLLPERTGLIPLSNLVTDLKKRRAERTGRA